VSFSFLCPGCCSNGHLLRFRGGGEVTFPRGRGRGGYLMSSPLPFSQS